MFFFICLDFYLLITNSTQTFPKISQDIEIHEVCNMQKVLIHCQQILFRLIWQRALSCVKTIFGKLQREACDFSRVKLLQYGVDFPVPGPCSVSGFSSAWFLPWALAGGTWWTAFPRAASGSFTAERCWAGHFPMKDFPSHPSGGFPANSRSKTVQHPVSYATPFLTSASQLQGWEAFSLGALSQL